MPTAIGLIAPTQPSTPFRAITVGTIPVAVGIVLEEMTELARLAVEHDLWVLSDDAYYEMRYGGEPLSIVNLGPSGKCTC